MNKKIITLLLVCIIMCLSGCNSKNKIDPDEMRIKSLCELSTLRVDYNNVARFTKEGTGLLRGELKAWCEYKGYVKIGVDMSKVKVSLADDTVTITMPKAEVQDISIVEDSFNKDSWIYSEKEFWNLNKITPEEQTKIISDAQNEMKEVASADSSLLVQAQNRAKVLIENYINQIGKLSGIEYKINWIDVE